MATASVTYTFAPDTIIYSGQVNTNFSDLVTLLNNYNSGSSTWSNVFITSTATTPLKVSGNQSSTVVSIDNTHATDGDSALAFLRNGVETFRIFLDDSDSDRAKMDKSFRIEQSLSGGEVVLKCSNTSNTASSSSVIVSEVNGSTAADARFAASIGGTEFSWGLDNSDSDAWVLSGGSVLGTNNAIRVNPTTYAVAIRGTATNDSATAGFVGETQVGSVSSDTNFPATGLFGNNTSVSLTAGDWLVHCHIIAESQGGTWSAIDLGIGTVTGNDATGLARPATLVGQQWSNSSTTPLKVTLGLPAWRTSISATTTYYLKVSATYSAGQPQYRGTIVALRIR